MKAMQHDIGIEKIIAFICGAVGGLMKLASGSILLDITFMGKLFEAGITAMVCGLCGVAGKHLFTTMKEWWMKRKKQNKKS